jgi:DNA topoisomerase-3
MAYICENAAATPRKCDFRTGKIILQRNIEPEQVTKLLTTGKTDLLHKFISKKGRPFSAFLVRGPDGKIGFEFAPREAKKTSAKSDDKPTAKKTRARKTA